MLNIYFEPIFQRSPAQFRNQETQVITDYYKPPGGRAEENTGWWCQFIKNYPAPGPPSPGTGCFCSADALKKAPREWDPKLRTLEGFFFPPFFVFCTSAQRRGGERLRLQMLRQKQRQDRMNASWTFARNEVNLRTLSASLTGGLCKYRLVEILGPREPKSWAGTWRRRDTTPYSAGISIQVPYTLRI